MQDPLGLQSIPFVGLFGGCFPRLGEFFFNELDYTNKPLIDKRMCSKEGIQTVRSWLQVVRKGESGKADSMGRCTRANRAGHRLSGAGLITGKGEMVSVGGHGSWLEHRPG